MESRRRPPSVIARLMGLDTLPPQQPVQKQQKKFSENYLKKTASIGFVERTSSRNGWSSRVKKKEQKEFKDVYEVLETSHAGKGIKSPVPKETGMNPKVCETKIERIRQKFMDAKRFSTEEKLHHSKEFHDALEVLDSNKDILLKFLQEPDSLFKKHLHDLQGTPPPPRAGHITILKSSNSLKYENSEIYSKLEEKQWKADYSQDPEHGFVSRAENKHNRHLLSKTSETQFERNNEVSLLPTRIVVLKPTIGEWGNEATSVSFPKSSEGFHPDYTKHREEVRHSGYSKHREHRSSENRDLYAEKGVQRNSPREVELLKNRAQVSREFAKEITRQMRNSVRSNSSSKALSSRLGGYAGDESSCTVSVNGMADETVLTPQVSRHLHDWKSSYSPSTFYSTESSVSKEAKKRISERLKLTHDFREARRVGQGSTLGEMLAMPDRETRPTNLESMFGQEGFTDRSTWNNGVAKWDTPLGISSRDGWKDECARALPRSRSLPASSTINGILRKNINDEPSGSKRRSVLKESGFRGSYHSKRTGLDHLEDIFFQRSIRSGRKKSNSFTHANRENHLAVHESQLKPCEPTEIIEGNGSVVLVTDDKERAPLAEWDGDVDVDATISPTDEIAPVMPENAEMSIESPEMPQTTASTPPQKDGRISLNGEDGSVPEELTKAPEESSSTSNFPITEPDSPQISKEDEHTSPVSVLEPPFADEASPGSDCFESVSADLQGLRMQLQLLKLETSDTYSDDIEIDVSSDEEDEEQSHGFPSEKEELMLRLRDENSRDFSYLIDVLAESEFLDKECGMPLASWHSPDCPVGLPVFDKLEKNKFGEQVRWPRSERRLLFDRINIGLVEIIQQQEKNPLPWINSRRKVSGGKRNEPIEEELWRVLASEEEKGDREEESVNNAMVLGKEIRWLELEDEIDIFGREIERLLMDELIAEIVISI